MPTTARDLITLASKEAGTLGVGQTLLPEDVNDCFTYLRGMMAQWQKRRWLVPALVTFDALADGSISYTVGEGGFFNTGKRPDKIQSAYIIQVNTGTNPVSLPLWPIFSREDYNLIALKTLNSLPQYFFYDGNWPLGNLFPWPLPSSMYRMFITVKKQLSFPADSLDTVFDLPEEYEEAIRLNLAIRICSAYDKPPKSSTVGLAKVALNTIKNSNTQISELRMPTPLVRGQAFNIYNPDGN